MENTEKIEFIRSRIDSLKVVFKSDRDRHKILSLGLKISVAILAATATVLLGWQSPVESQKLLIQNLVLVINASITVIAVYEAFFRPKKLWIRETIVFSKLKDIERDFEYALAGSTLTEEHLTEYKDKINSILKASLEEWVEDKKREN